MIALETGERTPHPGAPRGKDHGRYHPLLRRLGRGTQRRDNPLGRACPELYAARAAGPLSEGYYTIPTIFANVANDWRLAREEIFGPVLVAIPWTDETNAIRMANDSHYGLAAYVWSHNIGRALRAAHAIEAGWVQVNQGLGQTPGHSYGGYRNRAPCLSLWAAIADRCYLILKLNVSSRIASQPYFREQSAA